MTPEEKFLAELGIPTGRSFYSSGNLMIECPFAESRHSDGKDRKPSMGLRITENGLLWNCFSCSTRGNSFASFAQELVSEGVIDKVPPSIANYTLKYLELKKNNRKVKTKKKSVTEIVGKITEEFYNYVVGKRGAYYDTVQQLELGYNKGLFLFPVKNIKGKLVGYVTHRIGEKYKNDNFDVSEVFYLEHLCRYKNVIVVEGMFDAVIIWQYVQELKLPYDVLCPFGVEMSPYHYEFLRRYKNVVLASDNDFAGAKMRTNIDSKLKTSSVIWLLKYYKKDPAMLTLKEFEYAIDNLDIYSKAAFFE